MPRNANSGEWYKRAEIDYFSIFIQLWLSFNSFYKMMYINKGFGKNDRKHIEELKNDNNIIKIKFRNLFEELSSDFNESSDEVMEFRVHLTELIRKYDGDLFGGRIIEQNDHLTPYMNNQPLAELSFIQFIHPQSYQLENSPEGYEKLGKLYITDNADEIWPYFIEIIYMIRNALIHGEMEPSEENHEIIKNCYHLLSVLIKERV